MDINKILEGSLDEIADNIFNETKNTTDKAKAIQKQRIGENVQYVIDALKKIEADLRGDLRDEYRDVANKLSERIISIKNGQDGRNGADGRAGKDGRAGRDGLAGAKGADGLPGRDGLDGSDGVSVMDANIDFDGSLIISLSNGRVINVGEVVSQDLADKIQVISTMSTNTAIAAITGGTIDGTVIGGTTPAAGTFTTLAATGVATFAAGTVALPSITTTGDTNTGVYFPAADTVGVTAGGTQRGAFSSTGLAVTGALSATGNISTTGASSILQVLAGASVQIQNAAASANWNFVTSGTGLTLDSPQLGTFSISNPLAVTGTLSATGVATFPAGTVALPSITTTGDTNTGVYFPAADTVGVTTGGTERMRVDSSGNVGIGATANASAILDAQSTTKGVRMPNMTTTQKNAIASPAAGLMVYDTTLAKLCVYTTAWETITSV